MSRVSTKVEGIESMLPVIESGHVSHLNFRHVEELVPAPVIKLLDVEDGISTIIEQSISIG